MTAVNDRQYVITGMVPRRSRRRLAPIYLTACGAWGDEQAGGPAVSIHTARPSTAQSITYSIQAPARTSGVLNVSLSHGPRPKSMHMKPPFLSRTDRIAPGHRNLRDHRATFDLPEVLILTRRCHSVRRRHWSPDPKNLKPYQHTTNSKISRLRKTGYHLSVRKSEATP